MRMMHAVALSVSYLIGFFVGTVLARLFGNSSPWIFQLGFGLLGLLFLTWPLSKRLGLQPPPPKCPRQKCHFRQYEFVVQEGMSTTWRCKNCGQILKLTRDSAEIVSDDGATIATLHLMWPQFFGIWRYRTGS